jgi:hypothetical protein
MGEVIKAVATLAAVLTAKKIEKDRRKAAGRRGKKR